MSYRPCSHLPWVGVECNRPEAWPQRRPGFLQSPSANRIVHGIRNSRRAALPGGVTAVITSILPGRESPRPTPETDLQGSHMEPLNLRRIRCADPRAAQQLADLRRQLTSQADVVS